MAEEIIMSVHICYGNDGLKHTETMDKKILKWLLADVDNCSTFYTDHSYVSYINRN
jgi:hypothetical protein